MAWSQHKQWVLPAMRSMPDAECIKPDLNEDYMSLFSPSVTINQIPFWGRHIQATGGGWENKQSCTKGYGSTKSTLKAASLQEWWLEQINVRGRGQRPQTQRQGFTQRPFLGKRPASPYGNPYQKPQKGGGKSKERKPWRQLQWMRKLQMG